MVEVGAAPVRVTFKRENFQILINVDENFIRFHKTKKLCWPEKVKNKSERLVLLTIKKPITSWYGMEHIRNKFLSLYQEISGALIITKSW